MITLGIVISLTGFLSQGKIFLLKIFLSNYGSIADVGLYSAGIAITNTYTSLVFSAMGTDYAPRLSSVSENDEVLSDVINRQAIMLILLISPLIIAFIMLIHQITILLYSNNFLPIENMMKWAMLGMYFRAVSWSISFAFIAKGLSKVFFLHETITNIYSLFLSIIMYYFFGITGLGIAFFLNYLIYTLHMFFLAKNKFNFKFNSEFKKIFFISLPISVLYFTFFAFSSNLYIRYVSGFVVLIIMITFSLNKLHYFINLKSLFTDIITLLIKRK